MKILFVSSDEIPHIGGKSSHILDLIDGLESMNIQCDIVSFRSLGKVKKNIFRSILFLLRFINLELYIYCFKQLWAKELNRLVFYYCKRNEVNYISVQDAWAAYAIKNTAHKMGMPMIMTMHTYFGIENSLDKEMTSIGQKFYKKTLLCELSSLEYVDSIITVDKRIKNHVEDSLLRYQNIRMRNIPVTSISNFTNTKKYCIVSNAKKRYYRKEFGIKENEFVVCCTRRLVKKNGVINLVKAMSYIMDTDIVVLIGGDGPQKEVIEDYINDSKHGDRIKLLGSLDSDRIRKLYTISNITVVPSITVNGLQEATSISAIEAMACGLPTIASNIGGLQEIIRSDETGILVDENNPKQIADAILRLKYDINLYKQVKKNSRKYIEENHSHIEAAKRYLKEFKESKMNI